MLNIIMTAMDDCNGKLIKTVKQYSNECKCNTYQGTLKVKVY